jgi:large conductance mechanosensitive channel
MTRAVAGVSDCRSDEEGPMLKEFREFAIRGNVADLAVGVIIGAAFNNIVQSVVGDIFTPVISAVSGGLDFSNYFVPLSSRVTAATLAEAKKEGAVLAWGSFITVVINFIIVAWVMFWVAKVINRLRAAEAKKPDAAPTRQEALLIEIRDLLKAGHAPPTQPGKEFQLSSSVHPDAARLVISIIIQRASAGTVV